MFPLTFTEDPTSVPDLASATDATQPLLAALEKYHAANGLYPTTLNHLTAAHLPSTGGRNGFLYSARSEDWVYQSDTCVAREKQLHGWILKETKEYQREVDGVKEECVTHYRYYQLQSGDFPRDVQTQYIERWAYFDSQTRQTWQALLELSESIGLIERADVGMLVDKQPSCVERFAVEFQQVQLLHLVLQHAPGSSGCQALRLFQQRAHHHDVGGLG